MARLSGAAVLLIVVVPLFMYTCALFVGIQVGRALERSPGSNNIVSIRGVVGYFTKELWDIQFAHPVPTRLRIRTPIQAKQYVYSGPKIDLEISSENTVATAPKARSHGSRNNNHTSPGGVISVGPWGGSGGHPFYMRSSSAPRLRSIVVYHSSVIHSLACEYTLQGFGRRVGPWGLPNSFGGRAARATINLSSGEHVTTVEGTIGRFGNVPDVVITSLTIHTSTGRTYGPYGAEGGDKREGKGTTRTTPFSIPAVDGCIVGFWGRSGWLLDAIGVYIKPCP